MLTGQDLGVCAMFHDVGYAYREGAQPAKSGQPAVPGYAPPLQRHASAGRGAPTVILEPTPPGQNRTAEKS